jgi:hypothetical protein
MATENEKGEMYVELRDAARLSEILFFIADDVYAMQDPDNKEKVIQAYRLIQQAQLILAELGS